MQSVKKWYQSFFSLFDLLLNTEFKAGRSVILTSLFLGKPLRGSLPVLNIETTALLESAEEEERNAPISCSHRISGSRDIVGLKTPTIDQSHRGHGCKCFCA